MDSDSNQDRQDNERAALKAIYGDQMIEVSRDKPAWTPLECILSLGPQGTIGPCLQNSPSVDLHIICSEDYPLVLPTIKLDKWKRISNEKICLLHEELIKLSKTLQGEVMIYDLAQHIEKFLSEYSQPNYESFYEEMVMRNKNIEEKERQRREADDEKKKKEMKFEIYVKEQAVKKALRRRQNSVKSLDGDVASKPKEKSDDRTDISPEELHDEKSYTREIKSDFSPWTVIEKGHSRFENEFEHLKWLGKGAFGDVIKVRNKLDDGLYAIKRIALNPSEKHLNKKITREVKLLSRLNHENVVRYYNSWIENADITPSSSPSKASNSNLKNISDNILNMLPRKEPSYDWNVGGDSPNSDESSSDWVLFGSSPHENNDSETRTVNDQSSEASTIKFPLLYMYIQMELCDKSTLRLAIDNHLYADLNRVWRLFREIVEGLCHIHQQGIIHRDLKPVNIFIGNDDHVKIGDFGLATTIVLQKQTVREVNNPESSDKTDTSSIQTDFSHTGQVGTALYVAPELNNYLVKSYNQKVDIFSLGIIFFEMCHPPMKTAMERFQILTELRKPDPIFSSEFPYDENSNQFLLVRWMLQHDIDKRPSSQELLQSSYIPPQKLEDKEVVDMIRRTLSNPQTKNYNFLIASCFNQDVKPALDATYNISSWRSTGFTSSLEVVTNKLRSIFQNHGASSYLPPLLTPAGQVLESAVCLMTRLGSVVHATYDLQMPFARFLAHGPNNSQFKRYAIDKVYRERPAGVHPKENYECAFDIVTPTTGDLMPEYEMLCVIWEILSEFPSILSRNCTIYINHSSLIKTMFKLAGIDGDKYKTERINILQKKGFYSNKQDFEAYIKSLGLPERSYITLMQWMEVEGSLKKVSSVILSLLKEEEDILLCKNCFQQLGTILQFCSLIGITCPVLVNIGNIRNGHYYSGLMVQVEFNQKNQSKQSEQTLLLQGGRYDNLVQHLKESLSRDDGKSNHFVTGFTLSVDKFLFSIENEDKPSTIDVLVCAMGKINVSHDKLSLLRDLWKSGVKTSFINTMESLEELQSRCRGIGIPFIVVLKDTEAGFLRIRTLNKDRYYEKKIPCNELLDYVVKNKNTIVNECGSIKQESKSLSGTEGPIINFITLDKLNPGMKRRYESQILNNLSTLIQKFSNKVKIEIIASPLEGELLKALAHYMDFTRSEANLSLVIKKYPRHKKIIGKILDQIEDAKSMAQSHILILYSLQDNLYKVLL